MIRLSYKQQKLVDFINNYRRYVELNPIKEFESKEALDMFIRENYNKAKVCRARGREMMGYYNNTKSGRLSAEIQRGKATNSGLCSTKQSEWNKILSERVAIKE